MPKQETIPAAPLRQYMKEADIGMAQVARDLGKTPSCIARWVRLDAMPKWVPHALRGIQDEGLGCVIYMARVPSERVESFEALATALDITIKLKGAC